MNPLLKNKALRVVNWNKRRVYDFEKKRMVHWHGYGSEKEPSMPLMGFVCEKCNVFGPYDHYFLNGESMCESCAVKMLYPTGSEGNKDGK